MGSDNSDDYTRGYCGACNGTGYVSSGSFDISGGINLETGETTIECPVCHGAGKITYPKSATVIENETWHIPHSAYENWEYKFTMDTLISQGKKDRPQGGVWSLVEKDASRGSIVITVLNDSPFKLICTRTWVPEGGELRGTFHSIATPTSNESSGVGVYYIWNSLESTGKGAIEFRLMKASPDQLLPSSPFFIVGGLRPMLGEKSGRIEKHGGSMELKTAVEKADQYSRQQQTVVWQENQKELRAHMIVEDNSIFSKMHIIVRVTQSNYTG